MREFDSPWNRQHLTMTNKKTIPWRKRFSIDLFHSEDGWCFRVCGGIFLICIMHNYAQEFQWWDKTSGIFIGYIPWDVQEGQSVPGKSWLKVTQKYSEYAP